MEDSSKGVTTALDQASSAAKAYADFEAEASTGKYPDDYAKAQREQLLKTASFADAKARKAFKDYRDGRLDQVAKIRADAEASREPMKRIADEMEYQRLMHTKTAPGEIAKWAERWLGDEQPERARVLFMVARDKGVAQSTPVTFSPGFPSAIETALDLKDPQRRKAAEIEAEVMKVQESATQRRYGYAVTNGIGFDESGSLGRGRPRDVARATTRKKLGQYHELMKAAS